MLKKKLFFTIGLLALLAMVGLFLAAGWELAAPVQVSVGSPPTDLNAEVIEFPSDSGATVHGWWCPIENGRGAVLLLPGIRANRLSMVDRARFLRRAGYSTLLIDLQATGETKGDHITFGWKEGRDVIAAASFIHQRQPSVPIAIIGTSLGGAAALFAIPPLKVNALVLEEVYPTIEIATRNRLENYLGRLGKLTAPLLLDQLRFRLGVSASDLRPVDHIDQANCPILIFAGENDRHTRLSDTQMLFDRARCPKQLWIVPNASHVDLYGAAPQEYEKHVLEFLGQM